MRRLAAAIALAFFWITGIQATASPASPPVRRVEQAVAEWVVPTTRDRAPRWFAVEVRRESSPGHDVVVALLSRGRCVVSNDGVGECGGATRRRDLASGDFFVDPVAGEARAVIRTSRFTHVIEWTAAESIPPADGVYWETRQCGAGSSSGAGASRLTVATGVVFGTEVTTHPGSGFAALDTGATLGIC